MRQAEVITVYEHERLRVDGSLFREKHLAAIERWLTGRKNAPVTVERRGVRFAQFVGVIQIPGLVIEVLPKLDRNDTDYSPTHWRNFLYQMLRIAGWVSSSVADKAEQILERAPLLDIFYLEFLAQVERIVQEGLIRQYRVTEENLQMVRGRVLFDETLKRNVGHAERHYCAYTRYTTDNPFNEIVLAALDVVSRTARTPAIISRAARVDPSFDGVGRTRITPESFERITFNRKSKIYRSAIELAKLILLGNSPGLSAGSESVVSILFDMNELFEAYVYHMFKRVERAIPGLVVRGQASKRFWEQKFIRPDIVLDYQGSRMIIDTKWKVPQRNIPADTDLKQMYAYNRIWDCRRAHLLYPATSSSIPKLGTFSDDTGQCSLSFVKLFDSENGRLTKDLSHVIQELLNT